MKKLIVFIFPFCLSACVWQSVYNYEWELASKFCQSKNSTVVKVGAYFDGNFKVECANGAHTHSSLINKE